MVHTKKAMMMMSTDHHNESEHSDEMISIHSWEDETVVGGKVQEESDDDKNGGGDEIAKKETTRVNLSKLVVYGVILMAATVVGIFTYVFMEQEEEVWYVDEFEEFAEEVIETGATNYHKADLALSGLCDSMTSYAMDTNKTLPFMTLPNFGVRANKVLELAGTEFVAFVPFVPMQDLKEWESYAAKEQDWILQDLKNMDKEYVDPGPIPTEVYDRQEQAVTTGLYSFPVWQIAPAPANASASPILMDLHSVEWVRKTIEKVLETRSMEFSPVQEMGFLTEYLPAASEEESADDEDEESSDEESSDEESSEEESSEDTLDGEERRALSSDSSEDDEADSSEDGAGPYMDPSSPRSLVVEPVFESFEHGAPIVGVVVSVLPWIQQFTGLLEGDEAKGMIIDLESTCDPTTYSFAIREDGTEYIGTNTTHEAKYQEKVEHGEYHWTGEETDSSSDDRRRLNSDSADEESSDEESGSDDENEHKHGCIFSTSLYMSDEYVETWQRNESVYYTIIVVSIFVFTLLAFCIYDAMVSIRQGKVLKVAKQTTEIVDSIFPETVKDKLLAEGSSQRERFFDFLEDPTGSMGGEMTSAPIADYFVNTTLMFADMVGFTSWSSAREPGQVFTLLETVYGSFDRLAERRKVFKVETVGDMYVAACGLPKPNPKHAIVMARFARDCLMKMKDVAQGLEKHLGPGTGSLCMRIGLHSGPCTAGVLRGTNARFQIFGDTVNTTARIESTGVPDRIHCSSEYARLLKNAGKEDWLELREDKVVAKGLGELTTYFLTPGRGDMSTRTSITDDTSFGALEDYHNALSERDLRLVDWGTEVLAGLLHRVIKQRGSSSQANPALKAKVHDLEQSYVRRDNQFFEEIKDEITLPDVQSSSFAMQESDLSALGQQVLGQLRLYVVSLAEMYHNENPFHNWEHACSVAHSAMRLLSRLSSGSDEVDIEDHLHLDDPLTRFAFVLSALIHDVDHSGVTNNQLVKEQSPLSLVYEKSIAEQNSLAIGWDLLMEDKFQELREAIYTTPEELARFRQVMVNCIMATDIMEKELTKARSARWTRAFETPEQAEYVDPKRLDKSKKAILLEHLIQASDVAHTMQHWHTYRKWNECLFMELHKAYMEGRADKDPSEFWYNGELGFFDNYIIPLASKLFKCGVLRVNNDEIMSYARQNRTEWAIKGEEIVKHMKEKAMLTQSLFPPSEVAAYGEQQLEDIMAMDHSQQEGARMAPVVAFNDNGQSGARMAPIVAFSDNGQSGVSTLSLVEKPLAVQPSTTTTGNTMMETDVEV